MRVDTQPSAFSRIRRALVSSLYNRLCERGARFAHNGRWAQSARNYRLATRIYKSDEKAWRALGQSAGKAGNWTKSRAAFNRAAKLATSEVSAIAEFAQLLLDCGRPQDANKAIAVLSRGPLTSDDLGALYPVRRAIVSADPAAVSARSINCVYLGTTSLCNASCSHCPTNKPSTDHLPRIPMPFSTYETLIRELSEKGYGIAGQISFGLHGDGLLDPLVVMRAQLLTACLPGVRLSVNTNGAAYSPGKHRALYDFVTCIAVHIESLKPDVYNTLMSPLNLERVLPKIYQIIADFPGKVIISVPINKMNVEEFPRIREHFLQKGVVSVNADAFSRRCMDDNPVFDEIAIEPGKHWCVDGAQKQVVIDSDGTLLLCCEDFERKEIAGNISNISLEDALESEKRHIFKELLATGSLSKLRSCSSCHMSYEFRRFPS